MNGARTLSAALALCAAVAGVRSPATAAEAATLAPPPQTRAAPADAPLTLDGPLQEVAIEIDFDGAPLTLSGAVRGGPPAGPGSGLAIVVVGGERAVAVMRKDRRFGLWMNVERRAAAAAPSLYALARYGDATPPGFEPLAFAPPPRPLNDADPGGARPFREALVRLRQAEGRFQAKPAAIEFSEDGRFRATIRLPATLLEGEHRVLAALMEGGAVRARASRRFDVRKRGLEAWIHRASQERPFFYGLFTLLAAVGAGWAAHRGFRWFLDRHG